MKRKVEEQGEKKKGVEERAKGCRRLGEVEEKVGPWQLLRGGRIGRRWSRRDKKGKRGFRKEKIDKEKKRRTEDKNERVKKERQEEEEEEAGGEKKK